MFDPRTLPNLAEQVAKMGHVDAAVALLDVAEEDMDWLALVPADLQGGYELACHAAWEAIEAL